MLFYISTTSTYNVRSKMNLFHYIIMYSHILYVKKIHRLSNDQNFDKHISEPPFFLFKAQILWLESKLLVLVNVQV